MTSRGGSGSADLFLLLAGGLTLLWRRRRALLLAAGAALPMAAPAQVEEGWYTGGMLGQAQGSIGSADVQERLADLGLTGGHVSVQNRRTAWRFFGGYQFNQTWSAELGYTNLGQVKTRITGYATDPMPYLNHVNGVAPHSGSGPELALMGRHALSDEWALYGRGGVLFWDLNYDATLDDSNAFANEPHSGNAMVVGIGAEYRMRGPWSARMGWDRYRVAGEDVDVLTVGVVYRFTHPAPIIAETPPAPVVETAPGVEPAPVVEAPVPVIVPLPAPAPAVPEAPKPAISWIVRYDFDGAGHVDYQAVINSLSDFLKGHPKATVELVGHTDSFGSRAYNARLSIRRAEGLKKELIKRGIDRHRITSVKGAGASQPIADNGTDAGRAVNRRSEINVYDPESPQ